MTYLNQRHFASAIGILLLVLVFLVIRYREVAAKRAAARAELSRRMIPPVGRTARDWACLGFQRSQRDSKCSRIANRVAFRIAVDV